jgi:DNA-binding XRE family transcriptional regulator
MEKCSQVPNLRVVGPRGGLRKPRKFMSRSRLSPPVHGEQVIRGDVVPLPIRCRDDGGPVLLGDTTARPPLESAPVTHPDISGHFRDRIPATEKVIECHGPYLPLDRLSSKAGTILPVTGLTAPRTMCPMGKATTPTAFKREFCERLQAARKLARKEQADVAKALGIPPNTYSKYESRSLPPHHLVPLICEYLGVSLEQLYGVPPEAAAEPRGARPRQRAHA